MNAEKYHRCPTCGHDWLECQGPGECKSVVFHLGDAKAWLPLDMLCDECEAKSSEVRTPAVS